MFSVLQDEHVVCGVLLQLEINPQVEKDIIKRGNRRNNKKKKKKKRKNMDQSIVNIQFIWVGI